MAPREFRLPALTYQGPGSSVQMAEWARQQGGPGWLIAGASPDRFTAPLAALEQANLDYTRVSVAREPTFDDLRELVGRFAANDPQWIIALGGGSVIDTAKAAAMLLTNGGDPLDYAEVIGAGRPILHPALPVLAVPTTAGAGAEATRNAVLRDPGHGAKVSLRSPHLIPAAVILDPELTCGLPPEQTAATGMDALAQLLEAFVSHRANPWTDALCRAGIPLVLRALERACTHGDDLEARADMQWAAYWSGIALTNAGLGAVHAFAAAVGGRVPVPHGLVCAHVLVPVCRANLRAARAADREHEQTLQRFREWARWMGSDSGDPDEALDQLSAWAERLPLSSLPAKEFANLPVDDVVKATQATSSMRGNPVQLTDADLASIWREVCATANDHTGA